MTVGLQAISTYWLSELKVPIIVRGLSPAEAVYIYVKMATWLYLISSW